jgi:hypothetical protein
MQTESALLPAEEARPAFAVVDVTLPVEKTTALVQAFQKGLHTTETREGMRFRTDDGMLVAVVRGRALAGGIPGTRVEYRTGPPSLLATRKGEKVRETVSPYVQ